MAKPEGQNCGKNSLPACPPQFLLPNTATVPDTDVFHQCYHSPDSYVDTNIKGTLNVLQAARELETQRVLVTSTSEVYGTAQYVPIDEKHPYQGQSPYSATKIGADRLAENIVVAR